MRRAVVAGSALALALLGLTAAPTTADAAECSSGLVSLPTVAGPVSGDSAVYGLSDFAAGAAVGSANGLPVYWKAGVVKKVPLPTGYTKGKVAAVNHFGLMVGTVSGPSKPARAFRYWADSSAIQLYASGSVATDVNNAGRAVGYDSSAGYEYGPGNTVRRTLALPVGYSLSAVTGISDAGQIVGYGWRSTDAGFHYSAITWTSSTSSVGTELQPYYEEDTYTEPRAFSIDNLNRIVGEEFSSRLLSGPGAYWSSPTANEQAVGSPVLSGAVFTAISQTNKIIVGYAYGSTYDYAPKLPPDQAVLWRTTGAVKTLPPLVSGQSARALAADNDGRAGGSAANASGVNQPVVWNCAYKMVN